VPSATTRTSIPLARENNGRMWPKRPEFSVEVVEATTLKRCGSAVDAAFARGSVAVSRAAKSAPARRRIMSMAFHPP